MKKLLNIIVSSVLTLILWGVVVIVVILVGRVTNDNEERQIW